MPASSTSAYSTACYAVGTPGHSWQLVAQGRAPAAHKGLALAAKAMAGVARDVFLDGSTFRDRSPHVTKKGFLGELQAGAAIMFRGVRISYTHTWQTEQFDRQKSGLFNFGSLAVSARF